MVTENTARTEKAQAFAALVPQLQPKVWIRGARIRVYLRYPSPYQGCAGGGDLGHVDFSGTKPVKNYRTDPELAATIHAALESIT